MSPNNTFREALKRLAPDLDTDCEYVAYDPQEICLDGSFTLAELEAIVAAAKEAMAAPKESTRG